MYSTIVRFRQTIGFAVGLLAAVSMFPCSASAQAGAIGAGVSGTLTGENLYENAPVFTNSALVLPHGTWAAGADFVYSGGRDFPGGAQGLGRIFATAFYGATSKLTLGVLAFPLFFTTAPEGFENVSGVGEVFLDGRYQFWRSTEGQTKVLGLVRLGLPTAKEGFGSNGVTAEAGLTATHQAGNLTLNGGASVGVPTDSDDPGFITADAAAILGVHPLLALSLEAFGITIEGNTDNFAIAPGARLRIGERAFAEAAIAVTAARNSSTVQDYTLLMGFAFAR